MQIRPHIKDEDLHGELTEAEILELERGSFTDQSLSDFFVRQFSFLNCQKTSTKVKIRGVQLF